MALNFSFEDVNINSLYRTGGTVTYTLTGFTVTETTRTITGLYNHFHSVADSRLYNLTGFTTGNSDTGGLYCPNTMVSVTTSSALSGAIYVPNTARAIYVVSIGGGGGGGPGGVGTAGGPGGAGGMVCAYYNFADYSLSAANNGVYLTYKVGGGGTGSAVNTSTVGGAGGASGVYVYKSTGQLWAQWEAYGGGGGGVRLSGTTGQPNKGAGGTTLASPAISDTTISRAITGAIGNSINNNNPGSVPAKSGPFPFLNTTAYPTTSFNIDGPLSGQAGLGGGGDNTNIGNPGSGGLNGNPGAVHVFVLY